MDNLTMFNLIVGFASSPLISTINQPHWSPRARVAVMVAISVIGGFLTAYFNSEFNSDDIVRSILVTMVASITFYEGVMKPTGASRKIEVTTSPVAKVYKDDQAG